MLKHRWPLSCVVVVSSLHGFCVAAQNTSCRTALGDVEVRGDLTVAAHCQLTGTDVRGNVTLFSGGSLIARDVDIRGNLEASRADFVAIEGSQIDGNLNLDELVGDNSSIENTEIRGNVSLTNNRSAFEILDNEIGGNLRASGNTGSLSISGNSIDGNLECSGNTPAPTGLGNVVQKKPQGQCQNLRPQQSVPPPSPSPPSPPPSPSPPSPPPSPPPETPAPESTPSFPPTFTPPPTSASPPATTPPGSDNPGSRDTTSPTLTLRGAPSVNLAINAPYVDAGATATDSNDGDLTSRIVVVNPVNTAVIGTYTITYSVSDLSGNAAAPVARTVTVGPESAEGSGGGAVGWSFALLLLPLVGRYVTRRKNS